MINVLDIDVLIAAFETFNPKKCIKPANSTPKATIEAEHHEYCMKNYESYAEGKSQPSARQMDG